MSEHGMSQKIGDAPPCGNDSQDGQLVLHLTRVAAGGLRQAGQKGLDIFTIDSEGEEVFCCLVDSGFQCFFAFHELDSSSC
jgi:hypothetical protein